MTKVALTGGIATGKSYVVRQLREAGVPVVDADILAHQAVAPGTPALAAIVARFGAGILTRDGTLDRAALAARVFADPAARRDLEAIVHPVVRAGIAAFFEALPAATPVAVADIPLLFETGRERDFDVVVVVACAPEEQVRRVMARDGLPREAAAQRIAAQWPIADKVARADAVIRTDGSHEETNAQVRELIARW